MHDASAFVGNWPFVDTAECTLERVKADLREAGLSGAAFSPAEAVLHPEPMAANERLFAAAAAGGDAFRVVLVPVINPSLATWREHLQACLVHGGERVRGVKILPNYHVYSLSETFVGELARELAGRGLTLCIQMRMYDERSHHPLMKVPGVAAAEIARLAGEHPGLKILACGAYMRELGEFRTAPNLYAEMSFAESGRTLEAALEALPAERLLLGTHAPLHYPLAGVVKAQSDEVPAVVRERIASGNFLHVFGPAERRG